MFELSPEIHLIPFDSFFLASAINMLALINRKIPNRRRYTELSEVRGYTGWNASNLDNTTANNTTVRTKRKMASGDPKLGVADSWRKTDIPTKSDEEDTKPTLYHTDTSYYSQV